MTNSPKAPLALDTSNYLSGWRLYIVIACLFFGSFLIALDTNIINVAIPQISTDFKALGDVAWYGTAYLLTITAFQPVYGAMYRYFQTDIVYRLSIAVFEVGSIICAAAPNSTTFIVGRAFAGLGAAGILQGALSIISQVVPLQKRPLYMGVVISVFVIAVTVGPVLGGVFTENATWRWCFWINLPIGAVVLVGLTIFLKIQTTQSEDRALPFKRKLYNMDPLGCLVFIGTVVLLLLALHWAGQTKPWNSADVIGCLVGAGLSALLFIYLEWKRGNSALIPLRVFRTRSVWTGAMVLFFLGAVTYVNVFFLPFWFQGVIGISPIRTGVNFIPYLVPQLVSLIIVGAIVKQFGYYVPYMIAGELICVAGQALLTQIHPDSPTLYWAAGLVVSGLGSGMAMQLPYTAVALVLADQDIPVGNAIAVLFYQLGGAVFISVGQNIIITTVLDLVHQRLPRISAEAVLSAGAANLAALVTGPQELIILRNVWNTAIARTLILGTALAGASLPFTLGMEWLNANKVAAERGNAAEADSSEETKQQAADC
ncbi:MFS general substrate transporter [Xylaria bambusicola]|uniref:MFS general substrate transporter n=1 Tax=Xylaria bambusicola TaxID=326684 RepID=UPI002007E9E7|nr:MFS general substrate transporter [Xylaria bambusicola]KAI0513194.1 MFS general substrate transporter [Xylaria bambusicola]